MKHLILPLFIVIMICACSSNDTIPAENGSISVYFCPWENCTLVYLDLIDSSDDIRCAFYDLDDEQLIDALKNKNADVIIDKRNAIPGFGIAKTKASMHNKFCIFDRLKIITGSLNPTFRGLNRNNNNLAVIESKTLAGNYMREFDELDKGIYGRGKSTEDKKVLLNGILVENLFCPEDRCSSRVIELLKSANKSVIFMTFSFTDDDIGDMLIQKHKEGIKVRGVFEKSQNSKWTEFDKLKDAGLDVVKDSNGFAMHHKVFIIDERIVLTGSYNPTRNGNEFNDENVLVIYDGNIAGMFIDEFEVISKH